MTTPSDEPDNRASEDSASNTDSDTDRSGGIYSRPRRRGNQDLRTEARASDRSASDDERTENQDSTPDIYAPPRRRSVRREQQESNPGIFSRITGRHRLDEIREARYEPYTFESNEQNLKWTAVAMGVWCLILVWLAITDFNNSRKYQDWVDQGITQIPPNADLSQQVEPAGAYAQRVGGDDFKCAYLAGRSSTDECPNGELSPIIVSQYIEESGAICANTDDYTPPIEEEEVPDDEAVTTGLATDEPQSVGICTAVWSSYGLLEFANETGLDCPNVDAIVRSISTEAIEYPGCDRALQYAEDFHSSQDRSRLIWLFAVFAIILVAFPYLSLVHRASRNLLTLKSEEQKHAPEWAVLHHFIPICNFFRPGQVFMELYKGSDPDVDADGGSLWKQQGKIRAIVGLWWVLWVAAWIFNPITVPRFINAQTLPELIDGNDLLILSDVLLILLGIVAVLMLRQLHVWQEMRFSKIGLITVTPPLPVDPLQEALEKQEAKQRERDEKKDRRRR